MESLDAQSLSTLGSSYAGAGQLSGFQIFKLALLKNIAATVAPSMATDYQSLISSPNVAGYAGASPSGIGDLLELALLQIIANAVGSGGTGGGSANYVGSYSGNSANLPTPSSGNPFGFDNVTGSFWIWSGSTWITIIA